MLSEEPYQGLKPNCDPLETADVFEIVRQVLHGYDQLRSRGVTRIDADKTQIFADSSDPLRSNS